jgi:hypothetical protein
MPNPFEIAARVFAAHRIREDNGECVLLLLQPYICIYFTIQRYRFSGTKEGMLPNL